MIPCVNPQCNRPVSPETSHHRTNLCLPCRSRLKRKLVPTCGLIPTDALGTLAVELLANVKPTGAEQTEAVRMVRGSRHRQGRWEDRPIYSAPVVHARAPKPKMARRLPEFLIGRRRTPTPKAVVAGFIHYHLALDVLGAGKRAAMYLAGATYFGRRALIRPKGQLRAYRGKPVNNTYLLKFEEFVAIGRLVVKAASVMGLDRSRAGQLTARYLQGVATGEFRPPIVVHPLAGITSGAGDHPLDHFLPHPEVTPSLPRFPSKIRRASGRICGQAAYPAGLDVSLEDQVAERLVKREAERTRYRIPTVEAPNTDWLFQQSKR